MVEIAFARNIKCSLAIRIVLFAFILYIPFPLNLKSQETVEERPGMKKIEIVHSSEGIDGIEFLTGKRLTRLIGEVSMKHNNVVMLCDSAHYYPAFNQLKAYSKVHMQQGDTLHLYGDSLFYDGTAESASVDGNVELVDNETHLYTNSVKYDVANRIARYNEHGKIINADNTLTSIIGIYYANQSLFHFKDSVRIVNPDYTMTADTMDYNTKSETAYFTGPSELKGDSLYLYCEKGWYDTKNDISRVWKNAVIDNRQQEISGDSLYYDQLTGYGESFRNTTIKDTTNNVIIKGNYAWYYKRPEKFLVTDSAMYIQVSKKDSLFTAADTINAVTRTSRSGEEYRLVRAFHNCRIFSRDLQAKCDSMSYSFQDSVIRLYAEPVIWSKEYQMTSDSIALFTKNRQADKLLLYTNAFVISQVDQIRFNQVKGRKLTGFFRNNEIYKIDIEGNGETVYFLLEKDEVVGVNQAKCARIEMLFKDGEISEINEYQNPDGAITPPSKADPANIRLEGFYWLDALRPRNKTDIFRKKEADF